MGPEKKVENQIKGWLDSINAYQTKTLGGSVPAGTPDIITCVNGQYVAIEVKRPEGGVVSALQKHHLDRIERAGGVGIIAKSLEDVTNELQRQHIIPVSERNSK